jgi:hypothetical protein
MAIKLISYQQDRYEFFVKQRELAEKRYKKALRNLSLDDSYLSTTNIIASETGRELGFYNDIVMMLGAELAEQRRVYNLFERSDNNAE